MRSGVGPGKSLLRRGRQNSPRGPRRGIRPRLPPSLCLDLAVASRWSTRLLAFDEMPTRQPTRLGYRAARQCIKSEPAVLWFVYVLPSGMSVWVLVTPGGVMTRKRRLNRIPWGRIVRTVVPAIRGALADISEAMDADSDGGSKITRAELEAIVDQAIDTMRAELVAAAETEIDRRGW